MKIYQIFSVAIISRFPYNFPMEKIRKTIDFAIERFFGKDHLAELLVCKTGHINHTYFLRINGGKRPGHHVLQKINGNIFKEPEQVMKNIEKVISHIKEKYEKAGINPLNRVLTLVPTATGEKWFVDDNNTVWRAYLFIENATTYDVAQTTDQAYQAAKAFGEFSSLLNDLPTNHIYETIPDFHNTPKRFEQFEQALANASADRIALAEKEINFANSRKNITSKLIDCLADGSMNLRVTHNDTKLNNVMIDDTSGEGICVIDLDTVMPGLALYDFGDCVRTATPTGVEDEQNLDLIEMDINMFDALVRGYLESAGSSLSPKEIELLAFSGKLITYEIGLRFLADHLNGDIYFQTHRDNHNLDRARVQFKLVQSMEEQEEAMNDIVKKYMQQ